MAASSSLPRPRLPLPASVLAAEVVTALRDADVPDETIYLAGEAASWTAAAGLAPAEQRAFGLVVVALLGCRAEGSTRLALGSVGERLARADLPAPEREAAARLAAALPGTPALRALVGAPGDYRPFIVEAGGDGARPGGGGGPFLYAHRDWLAEDRLAAALAARLGARGPEPAAAFTSPPAALVTAAVAEAAPPGRRWTDEQEAALRAVLTRPLAVITGGPGTGKTALVSGILRALVTAGLRPDEIALCAPTGRAANRIAETLPPDLAGGAPPPLPRTLHRLLGYGGGAGLGLDGGEFRHHENYPLPHRAVIVDETSMVDLALMERLARAVRPDARLVLLGDADQLPSVDAGAVFRDLGGLAVTLTRSHRMSADDPAGAAVLAAARAVRAGDLGELPAPLRAPADVTFAGFEQLEPAGAPPLADARLLSAFLDRWAATRVRALDGYDDLCSRSYRLRRDPAPRLDEADAAALGALLDHHRRLRVLALPRGAAMAAGAEALNAALARRATPAGSRGVSAGGGPGGSWIVEPAPGAPVLMTRNDYARGLYNGDQGVLALAAAAGERPRLVAAFPRAGAPAGLVVFPFEALRHDLRLAYASTVHKAQGAELDHAALILPDRDLPLLSRELLYTAVTRARRSVTVVGRRALFERGAARPLERASGLGARLDARLRAARPMSPG